MLDLLRERGRLSSSQKPYCETPLMPLKISQPGAHPPPPYDNGRETSPRSGQSAHANFLASRDELYFNGFDSKIGGERRLLILGE